jgi:hypothetical protein
MDQQSAIDQSDEGTEMVNKTRRHPTTLENTPEETINRMRSLPERAAKLKETLRAFRETNSY